MHGRFIVLFSIKKTKDKKLSVSLSFFAFDWMPIEKRIFIFYF